MASPIHSAPVEFVVKNEVQHEIQPGIFGQFLERESHEPGPESAYDPETGNLRPHVIERLKQMNIPNIRFPGGGSVEYGKPWTHLIPMPEDSPEARKEEGRQYGFHKFLELCEILDADPIIVVRLSAHIKPWLKLSLEENIEAAAAQVAYFNAPLDADLPESLKKWPKLRAENGHSEPYNVRLWQLGNELFWAFSGFLQKEGVADEEISRRYVELLEKHIEAMKAVDPSIEFLVDVQSDDNPGVPVLDRVVENLGDEIDYLTYHIYRSWATEKIERNGEDFDPRNFTFADYYYSFAASPWIDPETGLSVFRPASWDRMVASGIPVGITEWNINSWWKLETDDDVNLPDSLYAKGLGTAGFYHAFFRAGDVIQLANQSMLVGSEWIISAIMVDPERPDFAKWMPTGLVSRLYSNYSGSQLLVAEAGGNEFYNQPFTLGNNLPAEKVAYVDPLATKEGNRIFLHIINRDLFQQRRVDVTLEGFPEFALDSNVAIHRLQGRFNNKPADGEEDQVAELVTVEVPLTKLLKDGESENLHLTLPPASVSVYVLDFQD